MIEIWAPANIAFEPITVAAITAEGDVLDALASGISSPFIEQLGTDIDVPEPGVINGFYVADAGGPNGFNPFGSNIFVVDDDPTVRDERVSSHEVGHILGLHHALDDPSRLMFSGTDGTTLSSEERTVAAYAARGVLDGVR